MRALPWSMVLVLLASWAAAQTPAPAKRPGESDSPAKKASAAMRQNPAIRAYFLERYASQPVQFQGLMASTGRFEFIDKSIDNLIDMNTDRVWKLAEQLHAERDALWASMTPEMLESLRKFDSPGADRRFSPGIETRLQLLRTALKKVERIAGEMDSQLVFIRFTMEISLAYRLAKPEGHPGDKVHRDIEEIARSVSVLEDSLYELYFPVIGAVSLNALTRESIPYILEKIRKTADRAFSVLGGR